MISQTVPHQKIPSFFVLCASLSLYTLMSQILRPKNKTKTPAPLLANPDMLVLQISSYSSRHPRLYSFFITHTIPTLHYTKPILPCLPPITHLSIMFYSLNFFRPFILTRISTHDFFCYIPKVFLMVSILDFFDFFLGGRRQVKMLVVP